MEKTTVTLRLDVTLTEQERNELKYLLSDAFGEFMSHRNVAVLRAGTEDDCEYYADYGADAYVSKRYPSWSEAQQREKAQQVRCRCRVAGILHHAAFDVEVI